MLKFTEQQSSATRSDHPDSNASVTLDLHFAYSAASDSRLSAHDQKYAVHTARAGEELFPRSLSPLEELYAGVVSPQPRGWTFRGDAADERAAHCFDGSVAPIPDNGSAEVLMRVREGAVVAAETAGLDIDQAVLDCAARAVVGTPFHGPHDLQFHRVLSSSPGKPTPILAPCPLAPEADHWSLLGF